MMVKAVGREIGNADGEFEFSRHYCVASRP
jgi:hypothetical protein